MRFVQCGILACILPMFVYGGHYDNTTIMAERSPVPPGMSKRGDIQPRMLAPGYYSQECNAHKACPEKKYCHLFLCVHCLKENVAKLVSQKDNQEHSVTDTKIARERENLHAA